LAIDSRKMKELTYEQAEESPCFSCNAPCCRHLQVHQFTTYTYAELDQANFFLNFENIGLTLGIDGTWKVYYLQPCRFLNQENKRCKIHGEKEQTNVCTHYSPYSCFYKLKLTAEGEPAKDLVWIDKYRYQLLTSFLRFDEQRNITNWNLTEQLFKELKSSNYSAPEVKQYISQKLAIQSLAAGGAISFAELKSSCNSCQAYCCTHLVFPISTPKNYRDLDYNKYSLLFPGIEIGITNQQWTLIVKTKCQHLTDDAQCGIYGEKHRPLQCKYYDEGKCQYKKELGKTRPVGYLRVDYDLFNSVLETYQFHENGDISFTPDTESLTEYLISQGK